MRGTCARVLAAALMTGAIATVVAMSALFGTPGEPSRPISAPPSSLQRSVRLTAHAAPRPRPRPSPERLVTAHTNYVPSRPRRVTVLAATRTHRVRSHARRQLTSVRKPQPAPVVIPTPAATAPAADLAPAEPPPPVVDPDKDRGHGRGHAYGHDKQDE